MLKENAISNLSLKRLESRFDLIIDIINTACMIVAYDVVPQSNIIISNLFNSAF